MKHSVSISQVPIANPHQKPPFPNYYHSGMKPIVVCNPQIITYPYAHTDLFQTLHLHLSAVKHLVHPTVTILVSQPLWRLISSRETLLHTLFTSQGKVRVGQIVG
jgi:hypothetical protein